MIVTILGLMIRSMNTDLKERLNETNRRSNDTRTQLNTRLDDTNTGTSKRPTAAWNASRPASTTSAVTSANCATGPGSSKAPSRLSFRARARSKPPEQRVATGGAPLVVRHVISFGYGHGLQRAIIDESQHRTPERLIMAQH